MSIYNREYMRDNRRPRGGGPASWSVLTWLIVANAAVFVVNNLLLRSTLDGLLGLSLPGIGSFLLWTPLTYQFVHFSPWHLLVNGVGLYFIGRMLLHSLAPRHLLRIYLFGGFAGGALQLLWNALLGDPGALVLGASASVSAMLFALIALAPDQRVQLLLIPFAIRLRHIAWFCIGVNVLTLLLGSGRGDGPAVAVMAHFGGMLLGWLYVRQGWHFREAREAQPRKSRGFFGIRILRDGEAADPQATATSATGRKAGKSFVAGDVDAILDKINDQGFQSLTEEERNILERSSELLARRLDKED